jgi:hypothetical protein
MTHGFKPRPHLSLVPLCLSVVRSSGTSKRTVSYANPSKTHVQRQLALLTTLMAGQFWSAGVSAVQFAIGAKYHSRSPSSVSEGLCTAVPMLAYKIIPVLVAAADVGASSGQSLPEKCL